MRVCIVGASGKLGTHMVGHALERGHEVVAVCREQSVAKLAEFHGRITVVPGATDDRDVIQRAVAGADGVLVVLVPRGVHHYASGKLGRYMVEHALDRGYEVVAVCREQSVGKLAEFEDRISIVPGATDDDEVIKRAAARCDGVLVVLVPRGVHGYSTGTAQAVLDHAEPGARLVFSCGWHITRDGLDVYSWKLKALVKVGGGLARLARFADLDDQVEACRRIFASDTRWTVVRGSDLEEDESQGLPVWSHHVGDPILASNITRRVDFALFMVDALDNDDLVHEAPAIVSRQSASALAHAAA